MNIYNIDNILLNKIKYMYIQLCKMDLSNYTIMNINDINEYKKYNIIDNDNNIQKINIQMNENEGKYI